MSNLLKIYRFEKFETYPWLALFREGKIRLLFRKHTLADAIKRANQIEGVEPTKEASIKLRDECVRGEHEDHCVWTWATGILPIRTNPKNPKDDIWKVMEAEKDAYLQTAGPRHFGKKPITKSWHSEPNATSIPKPKKTCGTCSHQFTCDAQGAACMDDEMKHWGAIPALYESRSLSELYPQENLWAWQHRGLHKKLEENPQTRIPDQMRMDKEFPFAYPKLADSFEEFDYSVNAPSEGGSAIEMMDKDDLAAEQILRARIARRQKWPFCPVHQRNVDLIFSHLITTRAPSHDEMLRHEAYWICRQCQAKK